jgi:hypothetical protein
MFHQIFEEASESVQGVTVGGNGTKQLGLLRVVAIAQIKLKALAI